MMRILFFLFSTFVSLVFCHAQNSDKWYQKIIDEYDRTQETESCVSSGEADRYIDRPFYEKKDCRYLSVLAVEVCESYTAVKCSYKRNDTDTYLSVGSDAYIYDRESGEKYNFSESDVLPVYPDQQHIPAGTAVTFTLYFYPVPKSSSLIDVIVTPNSRDDFNIYKLDITGSKHQAPLVKVIVKKEKKTEPAKAAKPKEDKHSTPQKQDPEPKVNEAKVKEAKETKATKPKTHEKKNDDNNIVM